MLDQFRDLFVHHNTICITEILKFAQQFSAFLENNLKIPDSDEIDKEKINNAIDFFKHILDDYKKK